MLTHRAYCASLEPYTEVQYGSSVVQDQENKKLAVLVGSSKTQKPGPRLSGLPCCLQCLV